MNKTKQIVKLLLKVFVCVSYPIFFFLFLGSLVFTWLMYSTVTFDFLLSSPVLNQKMKVDVAVPSVTLFVATDVLDAPSPKIKIDVDPICRGESSCHPVYLERVVND